MRELPSDRRAYTGHVMMTPTDLDAVEVEDVGAAAEGDGEPVLVVGRGVGLRWLK